RLARRALEGIAEVDELRMGLVLDQAEQVRAGRNQRPADVVLREPLQLPQESVPATLQVFLEDRLGIVCRHAPSLTRAQNPSLGPSGSPGRRTLTDSERRLASSPVATDRRRRGRPPCVRQLGGGVSAPTSSIRYRALVLLDGYCGLRPGELAGLRRGRIDLLRCAVGVTGLEPVTSAV